jgi:hypothetical protein
MKLSFLLPLLCLALAGCHDDTPAVAPLVLTGDYQTGSVVVATPIVMYTSTGPVQSPTVVDNFLRRQYYNYLTNGYFSRTDEVITDGSYLALSIRPDKRATLTLGAPGATNAIETEVLDQQLSYFTLAHMDSTQTAYINSGPDRCALLGEQIGVAQPGKRCVRASPATGYSSFCKLRPVYAIAIRDRQLYLPVFSWYIKAATQCGLAYSRTRNVFNPAVLSQLTTGDTLVIQTREIALVKK